MKVVVSRPCRAPYANLNVGQIGSPLKQRYIEHIRYTKHNHPQSAYALHIIQNIHAYRLLQDSSSSSSIGATALGGVWPALLQDTTTLLHVNKGLYMNTLEQFYIQLFN